MSHKHQEFKPFADESVSLQIGDLTIENRLVCVSVYGSIDLTLDKVGLAQVRQLKIVLDAVAAELEVKERAGVLPEEIEIEKPELVDNPFK